MKPHFVDRDEDERIGKTDRVQLQRLRNGSFLVVTSDVKVDLNLTKINPLFKTDI